MKKFISTLSLLAVVAFAVPAFAQDTDPTTPPATPAPTDCKTLKGKAKKDCIKAEKEAKKAAKKAEKEAKKAEKAGKK